MAMLKTELNQRLRHEVEIKDADLPPRSYISNNPVPQLAVEYLRLTLTKMYRLVVDEWLMTVYALGYQPQFEVIMLLVRYGGFLTHERLLHSRMGLIRGLLGAHGATVTDLILLSEDLSDQQIRIISSWLRRPLGPDADYASDKAVAQVTKNFKHTFERNQINLYRGVRQLRRVWSLELTELFLMSIPQTKQTEQMMGELILYSHYFSLDLPDEALENLLNAPSETGQYILVGDNPKHQERIGKVRCVLQFRRRMIRALKNGV